MSYRYKTRAHKAEGRLAEEASKQKTTNQPSVEVLAETASSHSTAEDHQQLVNKVPLYDWLVVM